MSVDLLTVVTAQDNGEVVLSVRGFEEVHVLILLLGHCAILARRGRTCKGGVAWNPNVDQL
ncbi:hypothetical protein Areg01_19360 [Actinoplanes regularis]|nr:hypothetical protein Are01nite_04520 [Actinoplanes regularis]GLW28996.1 hypothetical protein Areg01_19360 [Actinoplanes regularis]